MGGLCITVLAQIPRQSFFLSLPLHTRTRLWQPCIRPCFLKQGRVGEYVRRAVWIVKQRRDQRTDERTDGRTDGQSLSLKRVGERKKKEKTISRKIFFHCRYE